jgi:hypothetical protein
MKKPEKEFVTISDIEGLGGAHFKKVEMVISEGKLLTLKHGLDLLVERGNAVAEDLAHLIFKASNNGTI